MKEYEIWIEGFNATGESATAKKLGEFEGESFIDACNRNKEKLGLDLNDDDTMRLFDGRPCIWACRLFDNETDARKSFG